MSDTDNLDSNLPNALLLALKSKRPNKSYAQKSSSTLAQSSQTIDLTSDDDEQTSSGQVKAAPATKKQDNEISKSGLAMLDRRSMEAERLRRSNMRASSSSSTNSPIVLEPKSSHRGSQGSPPVKRRRVETAVPDKGKLVEIIEDDHVSTEVASNSAQLASDRHSVGKEPHETKNAESPSTTELNRASPSIRSIASTLSKAISPPQKIGLPLSSAPTVHSRKVSGSKDTSASLEYPNGVVKRTWAFKHERQNDIKIEEVLQKRTLNIAVISSFQWDLDWLMSKLEERTKLIMIMQAKEEATRQQYREETKDQPRFELCFPPMPGQVNCMHSKLMLLFHADHLRIGIPTANIVPYDWGESKPAAMMENTVFLIDLPRLEGGIQEREDLTDFGKSLLVFMDAMQLQEQARKGILKFDFSRTQNLAFIHTIGGSHYGAVMQSTGCFGLSQAIRTLNLACDDSLNIDFAASSIGSLNEPFLTSINRAAQGARIPKDGKAAPIELKDRFRVFFPTRATVEASTGGTDNAGTICLQKKWWDATTFPSHLFLDYQSTRSGLLSHNKILFARGVNPQQGDAEASPIAWAYVGSANLSESAWGKPVFDRQKKEVKLNCRNWECGVIVPVSNENILMNQSMALANERDSQDLDEVDEEEARRVYVPTMGVFEGTVDVPMKWPSKAIGSRMPWFFSREWN